MTSIDNASILEHISNTFMNDQQSKEALLKVLNNLQSKMIKNLAEGPAKVKKAAVNAAKDVAKLEKKAAKDAEKTATKAERERIKAEKAELIVRSKIAGFIETSAIESGEGPSSTISARELKKQEARIEEARLIELNRERMRLLE
jgi:hypothetical protein